MQRQCLLILLHLRYRLIKKADELKALVDEHYEYEKENTPVFHVVYEDIPENFYDDQALFQIPVRGLAVLFIMLTALAGSSQFRHDAKKGRFLLRRPDEKWFVPFLYSYLPALFLSVFGLLALIIGSVAPVNVTLIAELALLIIFSALCSILCTLLGQIIKSSLAFDALIPVILLFCLFVLSGFNGSWRFHSRVQSCRACADKVVFCAAQFHFVTG